MFVSVCADGKRISTLPGRLMGAPNAMSSLARTNRYLPHDSGVLRSNLALRRLDGTQIHNQPTVLRANAYSHTLSSSPELEVFYAVCPSSHTHTKHPSASPHQSHHPLGRLIASLQSQLDKRQYRKTQQPWPSTRPVSANIK